MIGTDLQTALGSPGPGAPRRREREFDATAHGGVAAHAGGMAQIPPGARGTFSETMRAAAAANRDRAQAARPVQAETQVSHRPDPAKPADQTAGHPAPPRIDATDGTPVPPVTTTTGRPASSPPVAAMAADPGTSDGSAMAALARAAGLRAPATAGSAAGLSGDTAADQPESAASVARSAHEGPLSAVGDVAPTGEAGSDGVATEGRDGPRTPRSEQSGARRDEISSALWRTADSPAQAPSEAPAPTRAALFGTGGDQMLQAAPSTPATTAGTAVGVSGPSLFPESTTVFGAGAFETPVPDEIASFDELPQALVRVARGPGLRGERVAVIQLSPPEMGWIRVRLDVTEATVRAAVETELSTTRDALRELHRPLTRALSDSGLVLERFEVSLRAREDGPRGFAGDGSAGHSGFRDAGSASQDSAGSRTRHSGGDESASGGFGGGYRIRDIGALTRGRDFVWNIDGAAASGAWTPWGARRFDVRV